MRETKNKKKKHLLRYLVPVCIGLAAAVLLFIFLNRTHQKIRVPDPALKKAIQEELGIGDREITKTDASRLRELVYDGNIHDEKIRDLTGIGSFPHLEVLDVHGNIGITDLSPLEGLQELKSLDVHENFLITDISVFSGLTSLETVDLERVYGIRDLRPLEDLPNLTGVNIQKDYFIEDLSPLYSLTKLKKLNVANLRLQDLRFLENFPQLEELKLQNNEITDLSVLADLHSLRVLNLYNNQIADIGDLQGLTRMQDLNLGYNLVTEVESLAGMTQMEKLELSGNRVTDLKPLAGMHEMTRLLLDGNEISDIGALSGMDQLEELSMYGAKVQDLSPLRGKTAMKSLQLRGNPVGDVSALSGMTELEYLNLADTGIRDISPLEGMNALTRLEIWNNEIEDISVLAGMKEMDRLEMNDNHIREISALSDMPKLKNLELDGNEITDVSPLQNDTKLEVLYLSRNQVEDVTPLAGLQKLFWLELTGNPVTDLSPLDGLESMESLLTDTPYAEVRTESQSADESAERAAVDELQEEPDLKITSIFTGDDNDGDAILLQSEGYNLLMDTGNMTIDHVVQTLKEMEIRELDIYVSHWHDDHYGQILRILDDDFFTVGKLYLPESEVFTRLYDVEQYSEMPWWKDFQRHYSNYRNIMSEIEEKNVPVTYLKQGSEFTIGSARAEVLYKNEDPYLDNTLEKSRDYLNNSSLATMVTSKGGVRYLTCGDIQDESEQKMLDAGIDISCDIFKMDHHGASTSNTEAFLEAASPSYAFYNIKEPKFNKKPYFLLDTVSRMIKLSNVFSGATNGDVTFEIRGKMIDAYAQKRVYAEQVSYRTADGEEKSRTLYFNEEAPAYLDACALPEKAVYLSGATENLQIRVDAD